MHPAAGTTSQKFEFVQRLAADLSAGNLELPSFPDIVLRVRQALQDEDCPTEKLVHLISAEPVLAARLLRIANSAALRPSGDPITDLQMAVTRIGRNMVRTSAMSFAIEQMRGARKLKVAAAMLDSLWERSAHVAALCYVLARKYTKLNPDEAMFVGLMHGIGRMYVLVTAEDFPEIFGDSEEFASISDQWDSAIGASIVESWEFAPHIVAAVRDYKDVERTHEGDVDYTDVLTVAYQVYLFVSADGDAEISLDKVPACQRLHLTAQDMITVLGEFEDRITALRESLGK